MADLKVPELSLVVLIGASGSGKSTFAARHFRATEVLSSDAFRGMVADDETDQAATADAFAALHFVAAKRLTAGRLTVIDATNVQPESRAPLVALAREHDVVPVAIVLDVPPAVCETRNRSREGRQLGKHVVAGHARDLRRSLRTLGREGFRYVHHLRSVEAIEAVRVVREPAWTDKRAERGPFDVIGDVHGCFDELITLIEGLGYGVEARSDDDGRGFRIRPPEGRRLIFLGDLVDRGPRISDVLRLVMDAVSDGIAFCIPGNHEVKLLKKLRGGDVKLTHGLAASVEQLGAEPPAFRDRVASFIDRLVSHYVLDGGELVVAHAGMIERYQGRASGRVRAFALFGDTTGETDEYGLPIRHPWAQDYRGHAHVVYGHTPVASSEWVNRTICVDTGCVFGGALTALRWPERELVSVQALKTHYEPARPLGAAGEATGATARSAQHVSDELLDLADVTGRRTIHTRLVHAVTITAGQAAAALEAMTRFTVPPQWLVHLPATMSPSETSSRDGRLEHPDEALAYYRERGVERVVCEEKHMGSRAVLVVCRDGGVGRRRFGTATDEAGVVVTRTGRAFFGDTSLGEALLERARQALGAAGLWDELATDWVIVDAEILPWSAKAHDLIRTQYAAVGAASRAGLAAAVRSLERAASRGADVAALLDDVRRRQTAADRYASAYRRYCWDVTGLDDLSVAPFHLLASEGAVHVDRDHLWHLATLARLAEHDPLFIATDHRVADLASAESCGEVVAWWEALTRAGGEGMVVKPAQFLAYGKRGLLQPAIKCRGAEYLRIIYGPEYDLPRHLERLRARGLGGKRALAIRETALGIEALERFVRREPLRRVHECVFGVLALETEPVDPRL